MAETRDLGVLQWHIVASDEQLDATLDSAYAKAQSFSAKVREVTKIPLTALPESAIRPAGGPESPRAIPQPLPQPAIPQRPSQVSPTEFVERTLAANAPAAARTLRGAEERAAVAQFFDPEGYKIAQRQAVRDQAREAIASRQRANLAESIDTRYENRLAADRYRAQQEREVSVEPLESPQDIGTERFQRRARLSDLYRRDVQRSQETEAAVQRYEPRTDKRLNRAADDLVDSLQADARSHDDAAKQTADRNREIVQGLRGTYYSTIRDLGLLDQQSRRLQTETRNRARFESEEFQDRLVDLPRRQRAGAIRQRISDISGPPVDGGRGGGDGEGLPPGPDDPYYAEYRQLRRQQSGIGGRAFLGRIGTIGAAYFAIREVNNVARELVTRREGQRVLAEEGTDAYLEQQRQELHAQNQGLSGILRSSLARGFDAVGLNRPLQRLGFDLDTQGAEQAVRQAQLIRQGVRESAELGLQTVQEQHKTRLYERDTRALTERNPFQQRRDEAASKFLAEGFTESEASNALLDKVKAAREAGDNAVADSFARQLQAFTATSPNRLRASVDRLRATQGVIGEDEAIDIRQRGFETQAEKLSQTGARLGAARAEINARFVPAFDAKGNVVAFGAITGTDPRFPQIQAAYSTAQQGAAQDEAREQRGIRGTQETLQFLLSRQPLQAQLAQYRTAQDIALTGVTDPLRIRQVSATEALQERLARQEDEDRRGTARLALGGQREQIQALLNRDPVGAEAIGIESRGELQARSFTLHGDRDLARQSLQNSIMEEQLTRQNYLDQFRASGTDTRLLDTQNPRDTEDPSAVLGEIKTEIQRLQQIMKELGSD